MMDRKYLCGRWAMLGSAALATVLASSAGAQTPSAAPTSQDSAAPEQPAQTEGPAVSAAPRQESVGLADIVVTAQRRGENLQSVPIAVTAIDANSLNALGGRSTEDLALIAPSVVYNSGVGGGGVNIRGIGGTNSGGDEPGNAIYVDGVYQASPAAILFQFSGIDRVEVLKGPQGTLFGRNASGGVIQVITKDPSTTPTLDASIGYANYQTTEASLYASTPLTSTIAVNVAAFGQQQKDGWGRNLVTGNDAHDGYGWGVRGKLKWVAPNSDTDIILMAMYNKSRPAAPSQATILPGLLSGSGQPNPGFYNTRSDFDGRRRSDQQTYSATLHHDLGFARLLSISAYDLTDFDVTVDADQTERPLVAAQLLTGVDTFTQEVQLQSPTGSPVEWTVGGFFMKSSSGGDLILTGLSQTPNGGSSTTISDQKTLSYSAFGQATVPVTNSLRVTAGIRYTIDHREIDGFTKTGRAPIPVRVTHREKTDRKPTWRLALDNRFSDHVLGYISFSRGFKSGLFNGTSPTEPPVAPQTLDAYEVGLKTETADRRLRINASAFYYDFKDVQFRVLNGAGTTTIFLNAGDARTYGLDIDAAASPIDGLTLTVGASLLDAKYKKNVADVPCFAVPPPPRGGLIQTTCSPAGNQLANSPELAFTAGLNYEFDTRAGRFSLSTALNHNSGYYIEPSNFEPARIDPYEQLTASIGWTSPSGTVNVRIWGRNLLNQRIIGGGDQNANAGGTYFPQAPRTYGITGGVHF